MFRKNQRHLQSALASDLDLLTVKQRKRLDQSWAGVFRHEVFARLDESPFADLYADAPSRPNIPVNVLVSLETLKAGKGWSDEELHDAFSYDVQVRYALGYANLGEGEFDLRTLYNFRHRLSEHMRQTGENLIDRAFQQITDKQLQAFRLKTGHLRMDTTQIASNIRRLSRLQLLVEVLQRAHRMLAKADQAHYADGFAPYLQGSSGQYVYHLKGEETSSHLQRIGELMYRLLVELGPTYGTHDTYQMLQRVFDEQFVLNAETPQAQPDDKAGGTPLEMLSSDGDSLSGPDDPPEIAPTPTQTDTAAETPTPRVEVKPGSEIRASSLLSPDDPEATFRRKGNSTYCGYVTNVTETCAPDNPFQLIVQVQTAANTTEDATLLCDALPQVKERTGVDTLYNDATFCSPEADQVLREQQVTQVPSDLRGCAPNPAHLGIADFNLANNPDGVPHQIACPQGQSLPILPGRKPQWYRVRFDLGICQACSLQAGCPSQVNKSNPWRTLRFSQKQFDVALRRQRSAAYHQAGKNLRAAVEATIGALKRPFSDDQLPVRGSYRVGVMMIGSALMVNVRRIQRYLVKQDEQQQQTSAQARPVETLHLSAESFLSTLCFRFLNYLATISSHSNRPELAY